MLLNGVADDDVKKEQRRNITHIPPLYISVLLRSCGVIIDVCLLFFGQFIN